MSRYLDILNNGKESLEKAGVTEFSNDAFLLFEYAFSMNRTEYIMKSMDECRDDEKCQLYRACIDKRCDRIPLQYITGHQEFMGLEFKVNEYTLIPRQDTEVLVEYCLETMKGLADKSGCRELKVLDMCTGSGCIGISIAKLFPEALVTAVDISVDALTVAAENARQLKAENIRFVQGNLFENLDKSCKFDIIVSNPPYIRTETINELMDEVRLYEPVLALDGMDDGLYFYKKITEYGKDFLKVGGAILYEIGYDQGQEVSDIMRKFEFDNIKVHRDLAGLNRVVTGWLNH